MSGARQWCRGLVLGALAVAAVTSVDATTLRRMGLDELSRTNESAVVGRVIEAKGYWNSDATFILTDVRFAVDRAIKGGVAESEITITLLGGTVGDLTTMIVAGADLRPDGEYLLFLDTEDLPGATGVLTVRDHCQGAFEIQRSGKGARALSQARRHPLLTDDQGVVEPPGGQEGLVLDHMIREVGRLARGR